MHENSHWYYMFCTKTFLPCSVLNDNEFKQTIIKQVKFTHIAKPAISNIENFNKAVKSEKILLNTLQAKIGILLSMTLSTLFPCFTWTLTCYHFIFMNCKASYQSQKITFKQSAYQKPDLRKPRKQQQIFSWKIITLNKC